MGQVPSYDLVVIGSGFASSFFLHEYLSSASPSARVLVLERGTRFTHAQYLERRETLSRDGQRQIINRNPDKVWNFQIAFGGSSNCWWANTPRMAPEDFALRTRYGVGEDWPLGYGDLEEYYCRAEDLMEISGPSDNGFTPRSRPYPQLPHRMSDPDRLFKKAYPDLFFAMPSARARRTTKAGRVQCCTSGVCAACPVDSKFTVQNEMSRLYDDPRVELALGATAQAIDIAGTTATGVVYAQAGATRSCRADAVVLGANGIFNPFLMLRSGLRHPLLGRGLVEHASVFVTAYLDGVENFQGSTSRCGHGYMLYRNVDRRQRAAALVLTHNTPDISGLRPSRGRWRQLLGLTVVFEDLRQEHNYVGLSAEDPDRPEVVFTGRSPYTLAAVQNLERDLERMLAPLPVEGFEMTRVNPTESHLIGTTLMGTDPQRSIVDTDLVHHRVRNLIVLGSGAFPTAAPANPTLTLCALALRSAARLFGGAPR